MSDFVMVSTSSLSSWPSNYPFLSDPCQKLTHSLMGAALGDVALLDENTFSPLNVYVDLGLGDGLSDLMTPHCRIKA